MKRNNKVGCRNLSLGLTTKANTCKGACKKGKPNSEGRCEGMNFHTFKATPTLGVGVLTNS